MRKHIQFESIDCKDLQYVKQGNCWVCLQLYQEVDCSEYCMKCKFAKMVNREKAERKARLNANAGNYIYA